MTNANIFRRYAKVEDAMLRATMPRTDAADPAVKHAPAVREVVARRHGTRLVKPLTATLAERMAS